MALKKNPNPTYLQKVEIPVPGGNPEKCGFIFKYLPEDEFEEMRKQHGSIPLVDFLVMLISGWDEIDFAEFGKFSAESFKTMVNAYPGAVNAIHVAFLTGRYQGRAGN